MFLKKELKLIVNFTNKFQPDLILAVGGGAVIDYSRLLVVQNTVKFHSKLF